LTFNFKLCRRKNLANWNHARIHSPDPFLRAGNSVSVLPNPNPQKNSFAKTLFALKPRRPARLSAEPNRKTFFSFLGEFFSGARKIGNCKESFSARQTAALRRLAAGRSVRPFQKFLLK